ncbi:conserved protein of unknown function (plasmid) [Paraburkholderia dioscoreae]|uniref:Uncharacterized protein n=1 Tax=Paraburkholderia dioscoreae TaxID=2604047 RepID=A0A5Q4ZHW7_9BURK|nr:conserved protein of unknown function [Paraburkholderia dioscoreae]
MAGFRARAKTPRGERPSCERSSHHSRGLDVQKGRSPFWSASAERQALKARRVETRQGLDAQLATRAEHAIAVSGHRPEMPLDSSFLPLLLVDLQPGRRHASTPKEVDVKKRGQTEDLYAPGIYRQSMKRSSVNRLGRTCHSRAVPTQRRALTDPHWKALQVIVRRVDHRLQLEPDVGAGVGPVAVCLEDGLHQLRQHVQMAACRPVVTKLGVGQQAAPLGHANAQRSPLRRTDRKTVQHTRGKHLRNDDGGVECRRQINR